MLPLRSIGERVRYLIDYRGMKQTEVAQAAGVTQAAISNIVTDSSRKPSAPTLLSLVSVLQANPHWVITGNGSPFEITTVGREDERQLLEFYRELDQAAKLSLLNTAKSMVGRKR